MTNNATGALTTPAKEPGDFVRLIPQRAQWEHDLETTQGALDIIGKAHAVSEQLWSAQTDTILSATTANRRLPVARGGQRVDSPKLKS